MPNTTNFNFPTPADTDLVKDGASAIRSLGNSIDTAFVDLKGGTTGQYLKKNSNTDLDYVWGDVSGGGLTLLSTTTLSGASTTVSSISQSYTNLLIFVNGITTAANSYVTFDPNSSLGNAYYQRERNTASGTWELTNESNTVAYIWSATNAKENSTYNSSVVWLYNYSADASVPKQFVIQSDYKDSGNTYQAKYWNRGAYYSESAVTSIKFATGSTFSAGTVKIYGVK